MYSTKFLNFLFIIILNSYSLILSQSDPELNIEIGIDANGYVQINFENSIFTAKIGSQAGGGGDNPTNKESVIQDLVLKSNGTDIVGSYIDACAFRGPATSAVITNNNLDEKTVRITYSYTTTIGDVSIGIVDYTIFANSPILRIDYIDYTYIGGWANTVDIANVPGAIHKFYGQLEYNGGVINYYPNSYWNTYDYPQDPADGAELNYRDHMIMAYGKTGTSGYGFIRVMPIYNSPTQAGIKILKNLSAGFETFQRTGQSFVDPFTGYISLFDFGIENAINFGMDIVNAHVDGTSLPLPVELVSFSANVFSNNVELVWQTASELNNFGFNIERNDRLLNWEKIGFVEGHGTSSVTHNYIFTDKKLNDGSYSYRLKQIDMDGSFEYSNIIEVTIGKPSEFFLAQNYPNPFNPSTKIEYNLKNKSYVNISIYNLIGQKVAELVDADKEAGFYEITFNASNLASGTYIYLLKINSNKGEKLLLSRKMLLIK